jgi:antitoxin MazE
MQSRVQKWGNSLAIRIPRAFALELGLEDNGVVDVSVREGLVVVAPARRSYTLDLLLAGVTRRNRHAETDFGSSVGAEVW